MTTRQTADDLIKEFMRHHPKGFDLSLGRISDLLEKLGSPQNKLPPIFHIAGTNGKGSASAYLRSLLEEAGYGVHVHTSPHLVHWHERYRLAQNTRASQNGQKTSSQFVDDAVLADVLQRIGTANAGAAITVFEILTAAAFLLFAEHPADAIILEVGLGGRFDATNVIASPAVSLIMPISLDHQAFLGDTIAAIAGEKAGIIKKNCPVVISAQQSDEALDVLTTIAQKNHAPTYIFGQDFTAYEEHGRMAFQNEQGLIDLPLPQLNGAYQIQNAASAIQAVKVAGFAIQNEQIANALRHVYWPGRMQKLVSGALLDHAAKNCDIWIDGGHNPAAGAVTVAALKKIMSNQYDRLYLIAGMINTKDSQSYFENFACLSPKVFTVPVQSSDAGIDSKDLAAMAKAAKLDATATGSIDEALQEIATINDESKRSLILICGSLYLAGDALDQNGTPPR